MKNDRETIRLRWAKADERRARVVPAGSYRLLGYRLVKGDWMISTTGGRSTVELEPGKQRAVEVSSTVHFNLRTKRQASRFA